MRPLDVLFEDNHLLVVNKPAGLATQGALPGKPSLVVQAQHYLKEKYAKPGNVFVGIVSRLDASVSGLIVLARTSKAAGRLTTQFASRSVEKRYWCLVAALPAFPNEARLTHYLWKDDSAQRMRWADHSQPGAQLARLSYRTLGRREGLRLLEIDLETGRKHQIRVQLAATGLPIVGDTKYGSRESFPCGIALHSQFLRFEHPVRKETLTFTIPPPNYWNVERFSLK